ncbi:hypothetical protein [Pseudonocardia sp. TRM90224]|uniref:hypothetical protein n=1 Tax=Pseudonocardia sp. TRM90224 TaxID=2812678 RepID=UPI001E5E008D|nr:hypothetical protein [Pseudonocardia sp. TRM90224]
MTITSTDTSVTDRNDPRLRLLGTLSHTEQSVAALAALDDVRVVIEVGKEAGAAHTCSLIALSGLLARLVGDVSISRVIPAPGNWWGVGTVGEIVEVVQRLWPRPATAPKRQLRVTVGARGVSAGDVGVGGGDWTAGLGVAPVALDPASHALGVHAAACLAVGQVLNRVLGNLGYPGLILDGPYALDLLTHRPGRSAPAAVGGQLVSPGALEVAVAGVGSVGTSTLALLAMAIATPHRAVGDRRSVRVTAIDADDLDPNHNPFRYPALRGGELGNKAVWATGRLREFGIVADAAPHGVAQWAVARDRPGFDGLLISSVDTVSGRLDVADVLARETLSLGVSGLALHAQRERFADGLRCPFCDYVCADPPATQAQVYAEVTGLPVARILQLLHHDTRLTDTDVGFAVTAGRVPPHRRTDVVGYRLADLVREAYAEAALRPAGPAGEGAVAVAAPHVSWFAGVLAAVEVVKQLDGLPLLDRRVDVDLGGLPPGVVRRVLADATGRCVCRSAVRRRWTKQLYGAPADRAQDGSLGGADDTCSGEQPAGG